MAINSSNLEALDNKGVALINLGKYNESTPFLDRSLAVNPQNPDTIALKGVALAYLGRTCEAVEFYNKALSIDPKNYFAMTGKKGEIGIVP